MPRNKRGGRISQPGARNVAGRLCFAAAAEALGGLYGSTSLERALAFTPAERAQRREQGGPPAKKPRRKRSLPTGTCKKWLHGHVASNQTLSLIAESNARVARVIQQARDSALVRALMVTASDSRFVGRQMLAISENALGNYLGQLALGHVNAFFESRLATELHQLGLAGGGLTLLVALLGFDRQLSSPRTLATAKHLEDTFMRALEKASHDHPEIAFAKETIAAVWRERHPRFRHSPVAVTQRTERAGHVDFSGTQPCNS